MRAISHRRSPIRPNFHLVLLAVFLTAAGCTTVHAQVSAEEREALIRFYRATGGDGWDDNTGWLAESGSECNWFGVQCAGQQSGTPFVLRLMLPDNNLVGRLPDSLAGLDRLATLVVSGNELAGSISPDLWGLPSLQDLFLDGNRFSGQVPAAILAMAQGMPRTQVNLADNMLDAFDTGAIPAGELGREIELSLNHNLIDRLPPTAWRATGAIHSLELSANRLAGTLELTDAWPELNLLDLSGNAITGIEAVDGSALPDLAGLNLADNEVNEWPAVLPNLPELTEVDISDNRLSGGLPDWFADLRLAALDLDNNQLSGPIADVFHALALNDFPVSGPHGDLGLRLHVANNRFSGALPDLDYSKFNTPAQSQSPEFGLDLCFNDIETPDPETLEAINPVHRGLALQPCIGREQTALDPTISGSWYHPARSGEGVTLMLLDNGRLLNYWFTYAPRQQEDDEPEQMWLVEVTEPADSYAEFAPMWITSGGRFGEGLSDRSAQPSHTWARQNRIDEDTLHFFYDYRGGGLCITGACFWDVISGRFDQTRLSQLAGTSCDNQSPFQQYAGAWYNPESSGEGFLVEVLPDNRLVVYWFTYQPDDSGQQAWMVGNGNFVDKGVVLAPAWPWQEKAELRLYRPTGGHFGQSFDPENVQMIEWGDFSIEFNDENTGRVEWNSELEDYGSGEYPIERLAQPMLAECESGGDQS